MNSADQNLKNIFQSRRSFRDIGNLRQWMAAVQDGYSVYTGLVEISGAVFKSSHQKHDRLLVATSPSHVIGQHMLCDL